MYGITGKEAFRHWACVTVGFGLAFGLILIFG